MYRPISNLPFISKLVERVIHKQLSDYVKSIHLPPPTQSGFRRHHYTEAAIVKVYKDIVTALDPGFSTTLLQLDFSVAFDCVGHSILFKVLHLQFGVTASALQWISSLFALKVPQY